jgi:hypothetical protein
MSFGGSRLTLPARGRRIQVEEADTMPVPNLSETTTGLAAEFGCAAVRKRPVRCVSAEFGALRSLSRVGSVMCAALFTGCGAAYYEQRLGETANQFAYYHELDANLSEKWVAAGIEIRVPQQFKPDLATASITGSDGETQQVFVPRQPEFFAEGVELPGLAGSWKADVDSPSAGEEPSAAYLYVMTNRDMFLDDAARESAPDFHAWNRAAGGHASAVE